MPASTTRTIARPTDYRKAKWYFARGWPPRAVAAVLKVHRNTVLLWYRRAGYGTPKREARQLHTILRLTGTLSEAGKAWLVERLKVPS